MNLQNKIFLVALVCSMTVGCSSVKQELGVARNSPDEFTVVKKAPLSVPPEFNLVPPTDEKQVNNEASQKTATETARTALFGSPQANSKKATSADDTFAKKLKVASAKENIRNLIDEDNGYIYIQNMSLVDKLTSKDETATIEDIPASTVDAAEEAKRLKDNKEAGKPINEGKVPVIEKKKNTLEKIF